MMSAPLHPTPYADVNTVLHDFLARIRLILGERFRGMYLDGSLALGDFDPHSSDIDFVVTTDAQLSDGLFLALRDMHARFDASGSPWPTEVEAVYIPQDALRRDTPGRDAREGATPGRTRPGPRPRAARSGRPPMPESRDGRDAPEGPTDGRPP